MSSRSWSVAQQLWRISSSLRQIKPLSWADFVLPSTLQLAPLLELLLEPVYCRDITQRIYLGLHEALVNAVRHGNSEDPAKTVRVRRILTPNWLIWQVQDEGRGISENARGIRHLPERLDASCGRGLFLIYQCFDDVRWNQRGNRLQLACRRPTFSVASSLSPSLLLATTEDLAR
ncbi:ATP-binding protein [cyanobiont of Ornithocercus magnificus]|nr:ATP-binding protein [cyanobiont of Ornithocercus magnificus]